MINKKEYFRQYYLKNKLKLKDNVSKWQKENKEKVKSYKSKNRQNHRNELRKFVNIIKLNSKCECGENSSCCLEFHHINKKTDNIGNLINDGVKLEVLQNEINLCKILCSNCHRKLHFSKLPTSRMLKFKLAYQIKTTKKCHFCNEGHYSCLDFHHLRDKIDTIGHMTKQKKYTLDDIQKEMDKCIVICTNCHRKLHNNLLHL